MSKSTTSAPSLENIAALANLPLPAEQRARFEQGLAGVMQLMDSVKKLDLSKVVATSRVTEAHNVWREDTVKASFTQQQALQNAKQTHDGFFVVPSIFGDKGG